MINNVMVKVVGEQKSNRDESAVEPIELVTNGNLHEKNGIFYLKYDEYYDTGVNIAIVYIMDYGNDCLSFNVLRISVEQ